jgi:hypothetical protein
VLWFTALISTRKEQENCKFKANSGKFRWALTENQINKKVVGDTGQVVECWSTSKKKVLSSILGTTKKPQKTASSTVHLNTTKTTKIIMAKFPNTNYSYYFNHPHYSRIPDNFI